MQRRRRACFLDMTWRSAQRNHSPCLLIDKRAEQRSKGGELFGHSNASSADVPGGHTAKQSVPDFTQFVKTLGMQHTFKGFGGLPLGCPRPGLGEAMAMQSSAAFSNFDILSTAPPLRTCCRLRAAAWRGAGCSKGQGRRDKAHKVLHYKGPEHTLRGLGGLPLRCPRLGFGDAMVMGSSMAFSNPDIFSTGAAPLEVL